jgi:hypothetical protein
MMYVSSYSQVYHALSACLYAHICNYILPLYLQELAESNSRMENAIAALNARMKKLEK